MGLLGALFGAGIPEVWFIHMRGCPACEATAPEVVRAARALQAQMAIRFYPFDLQKERWQATRWLPRVTPTLVLVGLRREFDPRTDVLEGQQSADAIFRWVQARVG